MKDERVDAYIRGANDFAKPILEELRARIHAQVPGIEEDIKWGFPAFMYGGKILFGMSAFKAHCGAGFWHPRIRDADKSPEGIGQFGKITALEQLPPRAEFARLAKKARKLVDDGVKATLPRVKKLPVVVPPELAALLKKNSKARATFEAFSESKRREYVDWITQAKRPETRAQRLATTVEWLGEGKSLMWKYERR